MTLPPVGERMHRRTKTRVLHRWSYMVLHMVLHMVLQMVLHMVLRRVLHMVMHKAASGEHETGKSSPQDPPTQTLSKN